MVTSQQGDGKMDSRQKACSKYGMGFFIFRGSNEDVFLGFLRYIGLKKEGISKYQKARLDPGRGLFFWKWGKGSRKSTR
jgi:hypothetical protein